MNFSELITNLKSKKGILFLFIYLLALLPIAKTATAQTHKIDSLKAELYKVKDDTIKVNLLNNLAWELRTSNPDTSILLSQNAFELSEKIPSSSANGSVVVGWEKGIANSLRNMGVFYWRKGNIPLALSYYNKTLKIFQSLNDVKGLSATLGNLGNVYNQIGDYPKALEYYSNALEKGKCLNDKSEIGKHLGNIGLLYENQGEYPKALANYFKALEIAIKLGNLSSIQSQLSNIGNIYSSQGRYSKGLELYFKALKIAKALRDKSSIAANFGNIGHAYVDQGDSAFVAGNHSFAVEVSYPKGLESYMKALEIDKELGNNFNIEVNIGRIGIVFNRLSDYSKALEHYFKALKIAKELEDKRGIAIWLGNIGSLYLPEFSPYFIHYTKKSLPKVPQI